jgi:ethanolamine utilization protein EutN
MKLGKVVGSVWGGKEAESLQAGKLLQVQLVAFAPGPGTMDVQADGVAVELNKSMVVALDRLGAGIGEYVLVAHGSRVRDLTVGPGLPVKEVVVAIVDACHVDRALYPRGGAVG